MTKSLKSFSREEKIYFSIHLFGVGLAWAGPFLFSWEIMVPVYSLVIAQFIIFKKCLMNEKHGIEENDENQTVYSELFEIMGFQPNRPKLKSFIRNYLHVILAVFTLIWQVGLGFEPLLF